MAHESNAFLVLFLQLGLHLFQDPDGISEVLEVNLEIVSFLSFSPPVMEWFCAQNW